MITHVFKAVAGLTLVVFGLLLLTRETWFSSLLMLIKGSIISLVLLVGLAVILWGVVEIKEQIA